MVAVGGCTTVILQGLHVPPYYRSVEVAEWGLSFVGDGVKATASRVFATLCVHSASGLGFRLLGRQL